MENVSERIIASHRNAVERAVRFLLVRRNLAIQTTEAQELVAAILGVANWQTLLSMGKKGRGPRIPDASPAAPDLLPPVVPPVALPQSDAERLADYYGTADSWGAHPDHPRSNWEVEVENGNTGGSYWQFVVSEIEADQEMFPWERDASVDAKLASAAGWNMAHFRALDGERLDDWSAMRDDIAAPDIVEAASEEEAWQLAAIAVGKDVCHLRGWSEVQWRAMTDEAQREAALQLKNNAGD
jgi:hypothetical protein